MANQTVNLGPVRGDPGAAASIRVGSVTTGEPGTQAKVVNSGTSSSAILDFTIPKGSDGEPGINGKSPYQVAVEQGYNGTETEFYAALVSLKDAPFLPLSGGRLNGGLQLESIGGVDGASFDATGINLTGKFTTDGGITFDLNGCVINGVDDPVSETDGANKRYVDQNAGVPIGCILLWSGSTSNIPSGWHLCDGQAGTPDLRDRFVVGAGNTYSVGKTGGEAAHTLTTAELPSHSHGSGSLSAVSDGSHTHNYYSQYPTLRQYGMSGGANNVVSSITENDATTGSSGSHTHTISGSTASAGSGTAHNNLPPYYALCYIMRIS